VTEYTDADRTRFRERQRQLDLAEARGEKHFSDQLYEARIAQG